MRAHVLFVSLGLLGTACASGDDGESPTDAGHLSDAGEDAGVPDAGDTGGPLTLRALPPTELSGVAGETLAEDCIVQAFQGELPAEGVVVRFEVVAGGGLTFPPEDRTGADGTASTRWTLGFGGPGQILRATADGVDPVDFTADGLARELAFAPPVAYAAGNGPWDVAMAKLGDDAGVDLVVSLQSANAIAVLPGAGDGTFGAAQLVDSVGDARALAIADFDGDDADDVVVVGRASDRAGVHLQDAAGALAVATEYPAGNGPFELALADFGGSDALDLAVSNTTSNELSLLLGDGDGGFEAPLPFALGAQPQGIAAALLDGGDLLDVVVALGQDDGIGVLLGNGDASFGAMRTTLAGNGPYDVALGDLDGDGETDAAVANALDSSVAVLLGNGDGRFDDPTPFPLVGAPGRLVLADMNGDGPLDVVVVVPLEDQVHVLRNDGSGGLGVDTSLSVGDAPRGLVVADLDQDGMPDLATANETSDDVTVLIRE